MNALERWHEMVESKDTSMLDAIIADDCVFYSPIVHTPQEGKDLTVRYLTAAAEVLGGEGFRYVREIIGDKQAAMEFETVCDGIVINGIDIVTWNEQGQIDSFKVMVRPLKAVNMLHSQMMAMLERLAG